MNNDKPIRPGEEFELRGRRYRVAATNYEGKLILHPVHTKETTADMMVRLQSTSPEASDVRVAVKVPAEPPRP